MTPSLMNNTSYLLPITSSLPGPEDITRVVLPNGMVVLARANFNSPSVVISGYLSAGSLFDPDEKLGLADFTASALMRGTERYTFQEIYGALESAGASFGTGGGTHSAGFSGKALQEDLGLLLSLLASILREPSFPTEHIERLRAQLLTALTLRAQDTGDMASLAFDSLVYAGHPYSRPEDGYAETVNAILLEDLRAFHQKHYGPRGMVIAVVGAVDPRKAVDMVASHLGDWQNSYQQEPPPLPPVKPLPVTTSRKVDVPGKSQTDILVGSAGPERRSADFLAASLGNSILGQFGMMGRIGEAVRERAGLAYYAQSSLSGGSGPGPWYVSAGVDPENVARTVDLIQAEIRRFVSEPVSQDELFDSQANYIGRLPLSMEANSGVAAVLLNLEHYDLGLDYYQRYPSLVQSVTPGNILETAQRYLDPDRLAIAVAGP